MAAVEVHGSKRLNVALVTPTGSLVTREYDEVVAPGELGEFGVLPGHIPVLAALRPGVLILRDGTRKEVFAVGPGYLQVGGGNHVKVLVDRAATPKDIDAGDARKDAAAAETELKAAAAKGDATAVLRDQLDWANARLKALDPRT